MITNIVLIMMATIAVMYAYEYVHREHKMNLVQWCVSLGGLFVFLWDFGYGMMGLCKNETWCYFWRVVGLIGIGSYLIVELVFVRYITGTMKKRFRPLVLCLSIYTIIWIVLVAQPKVVRFFEYHGRTAYESKPCIGRTMEGIFIAIMFSIMLGMAIKWWRSIKIKREREIVTVIYFAHSALMLACIPDTVLPILGCISFPSSGMGAFVCFVFNVFVADQLSAFDLSSNSMNNYIYHNVQNSVMFFDANGKLILANEYALKFFDIGSNDKRSFYDLFEVTAEESHRILNQTDIENADKGVRIYSRRDHRICSLILNTIRDRYDEPMYTACLAYDFTKEQLMYDEVNEMKIQLQMDLEKKTREMERLTLQSITTIANTIDARDEYTKGHSERVANYSSLIAEELGWSESEISDLKNAVLLHDIGKIGLEDAILNKPGKLTKEEYDKIKQHTNIGSAILQDITMIPNLDAGAKYHHEHYDGTGYPNGLIGEQIPIITRVICVADAFDAMNTKRVYRDSLPIGAIIEELERERGKQFDPTVVDAFMRVHSRGNIC